MYIWKNGMNRIHDDGIDGCEKNDGRTDNQNGRNAVFDA